MLIRFNIKNFLSFSGREEGKSEEFSMIAGKVRNKKAHVYDNEKIKLIEKIKKFQKNRIFSFLLLRECIFADPKQF